MQVGIYKSKVTKLGTAKFLTGFSNGELLSDRLEISDVFIGSYLCIPLDFMIYFKP
jgi:hypothetical protein